MVPSSRGLGHRPFTAGTGIRIPLGLPYKSTLKCLGQADVAETALPCAELAGSIPVECVSIWYMPYISQLSLTRKVKWGVEVERTCRTAHTHIHRDTSWLIYGICHIKEY